MVDRLGRLILWRDGGPADEQRSFDLETHSIAGTGRLQFFVRLVWTSKGKRDHLDKTLETTSGDDPVAVFQSFVEQALEDFARLRQQPGDSGLTPKVTP